MFVFFWKNAYSVFAYSRSPLNVKVCVAAIGVMRFMCVASVTHFFILRSSQMRISNVRFKKITAIFMIIIVLCALPITVSADEVNTVQSETVYDTTAPAPQAEQNYTETTHIINTTDFQITLSKEDYTYNGKTRTPSVTVTDNNGNVLRNNVDYNVIYSNGRKNIGKYKVTIKFKGNYSGTVTKYFTINPKITLSKTSCTFNGKVQKPTVTVKDAKGNKINKKYYKVSYAKGMKNVGIYDIKITFKGKHKGSYKKTFTIRPKTTKITHLTSKDCDFTVKWKKVSGVTGYQIQYATNKKFKNAKTTTVKGANKTSKTVKKLNGNKKYYVRVRTYKTVKINNKNIKKYSSYTKANNLKVRIRWCTDGGTKHVIPDDAHEIGWYNSYDEAKQGALKYMGDNGGGYTVIPCSCGKYTASIVLEGQCSDCKKWYTYEYCRNKQHYQICKDCNKKLLSYCCYDEEIVKPTTTKQGYTLYKCIDCGHSYKDNYIKPIR